MQKTTPVGTTVLVALFAVATGWGLLAGRAALAGQPATADFKPAFLKLCDVACGQLNTEERHKDKSYNGRHPAYHYEDSYAVRALAVAYDLTGDKRYLDACKVWSEQMAAFQDKMIPAGAYYMNYGRKPGTTKGGWYVADSSSIALGVLATAVRCEDPAQKDRYLKSVESFAKLVIDNYVGPAGGITDGLWEKYDGEWWCSSGIFGSLAFVLYEETGDETYRKVALDALDWLNGLEFNKVKHISFEDAAPAVIMYILEGYSAAWGRLDAGSDRLTAAESQMNETLQWMAKNQKSRRADSPWDYNSQWGSKLGGLPFHVYVYAGHSPEGRDLHTAADRELRHVESVLGEDKEPKLTQLAAFAMMSYAERVSPGAVYRKSKR